MTHFQELRVTSIHSRMNVFRYFPKRVTKALSTLQILYPSLSDNEIFDRLNASLGSPRVDKTLKEMYYDENNFSLLENLPREIMFIGVTKYLGVVDKLHLAKVSKNLYRECIVHTPKYLFSDSEKVSLRSIFFMKISQISGYPDFVLMESEVDFLVSLGCEMDTIFNHIEGRKKILSNPRTGACPIHFHEGVYNAFNLYRNSLTPEDKQKFAKKYLRLYTQLIRKRDDFIPDEKEILGMFRTSYPEKSCELIKIILEKYYRIRKDLHPSTIQIMLDDCHETIQNNWVGSLFECLYDIFSSRLFEMGFYDHGVPHVDYNPDDWNWKIKNQLSDTYTMDWIELCIESYISCKTEPTKTSFLYKIIERLKNSITEGKYLFFTNTTDEYPYNNDSDPPVKVCVNGNCKELFDLFMSDTLLAKKYLSPDSIEEMIDDCEMALLTCETQEETDLNHHFIQVLSALIEKE